MRSGIETSRCGLITHCPSRQLSVAAPPLFLLSPSAWEIRSRPSSLHSVLYWQGIRLSSSYFSLITTAGGCAPLASGWQHPPPCLVRVVCRAGHLGGVKGKGINYHRHISPPKSHACRKGRAYLRVFRNRVVLIAFQHYRRITPPVPHRASTVPQTDWYSSYPCLREPSYTLFSLMYLYHYCRIVRHPVLMVARDGRSCVPPPFPRAS